MRIIEDRYDGIIIDSETLPKACSDFEKEITMLLGALQGKKLLWIKIPSSHSAFIPVLTELDFEFHHCAGNSVMLVKKLTSNPIIPNPKNFGVGVGAIVQNGENLLVVKDRFSTGYKLPGGLVDPAETLASAMEREVLEETGIIASFESIINVGHFMNGQFGEHNLYFVCTAHHKTTEITIHDSSEIVDARWMNTLDFLNSDAVNNYNKAVVNSVVKDCHSKLTHHPVELRVPAEIFL